MDECSPLLIHRYSDSADLPNPNLRPRHRELIPTPCGPIKPWSELTCLVKLYYCLTIVSLLAVLAVTAVNIYSQIQDLIYHEDFTISLVQLVGILFCCYYVTRGILQENRQELIVFVASVVLVMMRSVVNFAVLPAPEKDSLILVRFVCIVCIGLFHVICSTLLIRSSNMMAFRVGGALESLQEQYFLLNVCFSMVTFDLQAQICLCILVLTSGIYHISFSHSIILGFGIFWASYIHCRADSSLKRIEDSCLGFCPPELTRIGLSHFSTVSDYKRMGSRGVVCPGSCCNYRLHHLSGDQRRPLLVLDSAVSELWAGAA